jgi:translation initiation factor IF-1
MRVRRQTVEHPFGTIKSWMGATHFQMRTLKNVSTEMALHVLAYNMKRVMRIREDKILVDVSDVTLVRFKGVFGFKGV